MPVFTNLVWSKTNIYEGSLDGTRKTTQERICARDEF